MRGNPATGPLERRLFAFLQRPAFPDASQAVCLHEGVRICGSSPRTALKRGGMGLPCSYHEVVSPSLLAGVFLQGVCCTIERSAVWQYRVVGLFCFFPCIRVRFIVIPVNCPVRCQLWVLLQRSSVGRQVSASLRLPTENSHCSLAEAS